MNLLLRRLIMAVIAIIAFSCSASAQEYEADFIIGRYIRAYKTDADGQKWKVKIPNGTRIQVNKRIVTGDSTDCRDILAQFEYNGETYTTEARWLQFSGNNPEGTPDLFSDDDFSPTERFISDNLPFTRLSPLSAKGRFLYGLTLPLLELLLMAAAVFLILRSTIKRSAIPFVIAVVLQVYQTLMLGNDALWWCLPEYQGLGGSFVGFIPLALYLALEFSYIILVWTFSSGNVRIWPVFLAAILQYFAASISYATIGNAWIGIIAIYAIPLLMNGAKGGSSGVKDTLLLIAGMAGFMVTLSAAFFASMMIVTEIVLVCPAAGIGLAFIFKRLQNRDYTARQLPDGRWAVYNEVFNTHMEALRHMERMRERDKARDEQARRRNNW